MPTPAAVLAAALFTLVLGAQCVRADESPRDPEQVYAVTCHYCHDNGIGKVLKGAKLAPERIRLAVRQGYVAMPAFAPSFITDAELAALVTLLHEAPAPAATSAAASAATSAPATAPAAAAEPAR
jgi:mono/diheme cytochrome c family protein